MKAPAPLPFLLGLVAFAVGGCDGPVMHEVEVRQPIAFPHKNHMDYFLSGKHREEKIQMHLKLLDTDEVPEEIARGECAACHDDLPRKADCASCHVLSQDPELRARKELRPCIVCHPGTWEGAEARIPTTTLCRSCHAGEPRTGSAEESRLREYLSRGEDVPWVRINTVPDHVYNSHSAHVRFGGLACTRCHADVSSLTVPPQQAVVFSMDACLKCHRENHATTDCVSCHQ